MNSRSFQYIPYVYTFATTTAEPTPVPIASSSPMVVFEHHTQYLARVQPVKPPETPADWKVTYPDFVFRARRDTPESRITAIPDKLTIASDWDTTYPDRIARARDTAPETVITAILDRLTVARAWAPVYPDKIDRFTFTVDKQVAVVSGLTSSTIPITDLRWQGRYPDQIWSQAFLTANQRAAWLDPFPVSTVQQLTAWAFYPDKIDRFSFTAERQQSLALEPFPRPNVAQQPYVSYPDWLEQLVLQTANQTASVLPMYLPIADVRWKAVYPDAIDRLVVRAVDQSAFVGPRYLPINDLRWEAIYPDAIDRRVVRPADTQALGEPRFLPLADLRWEAAYPDWLRGLPRAADYPAFTTGLTSSVIPITDLRWQAKFADFVLRTTLPTAGIPSLALEPFPRPGSNQLTAWAFYPDRIVRTTLPAGAMPYFVPGPFIPIPNPPVVIIDDKITIGIKDSLDVTVTPILGGFHSW